MVLCSTGMPGICSDVRLDAGRPDCPAQLTGAGVQMVAFAGLCWHIVYVGLLLLKLWYAPIPSSLWIPSAQNSDAC